MNRVSFCSFISRCFSLMICNRNVLVFFPARILLSTHFHLYIHRVARRKSLAIRIVERPHRCRSIEIELHVYKRTEPTDFEWIWYWCRFCVRVTEVKKKKKRAKMASKADPVTHARDSNGGLYGHNCVVLVCMHVYECVHFYKWTTHRQNAAKWRKYFMLNENQIRKKKNVENYWKSNKTWNDFQVLIDVQTTNE